MKKYKAGVLFGEELEALYKDAKDNQFALPAVNTTGTNTINAIHLLLSNFQMVVRNLWLAKECLMIKCRQIFPVASQEHYIFIM
jgi:hypothetical protein